MRSFIVLFASITNIYKNEAFVKESQSARTVFTAPTGEAQLYRDSAALIDLIHRYDRRRKEDRDGEGHTLDSKVPEGIDLDYMGLTSENKAVGRMMRVLQRNYDQERSREGEGSRSAVRTYHMSNPEVLEQYLQETSNEDSSMSMAEEGTSTSDDVKHEMWQALRDIRRNARYRISNPSSEINDNEELLADTATTPVDDKQLSLSEDILPIQARNDYDEKGVESVTRQIEKSNEMNEKEIDRDNEVPIEAVSNKYEWNKEEEKTTKDDNWDAVTKKWNWDKSLEKDKSWEKGDKENDNDNAKQYISKGDIDWGDDIVKDNTENEALQFKNTAKKWEEPKENKWIESKKEKINDDKYSKKWKDNEGYDDYGNSKTTKKWRKDKKNNAWEDSYRDIPKKTYDKPKNKPYTYDKPRVNYDKPKQKYGDSHLLGRTPIPIVGKKIVYDDK